MFVPFDIMKENQSPFSWFVNIVDLNDYSASDSKPQSRFCHLVSEVH